MESLDTVDVCTDVRAFWIVWIITLNPSERHSFTQTAVPCSILCWGGEMFPASYFITALKGSRASVDRKDSLWISRPFHLLSTWPSRKAACPSIHSSFFLLLHAHALLGSRDVLLLCHWLQLFIGEHTNRCLVDSVCFWILLWVILTKCILCVFNA